MRTLRMVEVPGAQVVAQHRLGKFASRDPIIRIQERGLDLTRNCLNDVIGVLVS